MAIEAMSTVHATDYKPGEIEIGIVSNSEEEDEKVRGKWRVMGEAKLTNIYFFDCKQNWGVKERDRERGTGMWKETTGAGARDASASRVPGMFFLSFSLT